MPGLSEDTEYLSPSRLAWRFSVRLSLGWVFLCGVVAADDDLGFR